MADWIGGLLIVGSGLCLFSRRHLLKQQIVTRGYPFLYQNFSTYFELSSHLTSLEDRELSTGLLQLLYNNDLCKAQYHMEILLLYLEEV